MRCSASMSRPPQSEAIRARIAHGMGLRPCPGRCRPPRITGMMPPLVASAPNATHQYTDSRGTRPDVPSTSRLPADTTGRRARSASRGDRGGESTSPTSTPRSLTQRSRLPASRAAWRMSSGDRLTAKTDRSGAPRPQHLRPADVDVMGRYQTRATSVHRAEAPRNRSTKSGHRLRFRIRQPARLLHVRRRRRPARRAAWIGRELERLVDSTAGRGRLGRGMKHACTRRRPAGEQPAGLFASITGVAERPAVW